MPDVWEVKKVNPQSMVHLPEKPVELAVRALADSSREGESMLDLFGGSGSTLMAAEQTGRRAFLMELDEQYRDVIVGRFENATGIKATYTSRLAEVRELIRQLDDQLSSSELIPAPRRSSSIADSACSYANFTLILANSC